MIRTSKILGLLAFICALPIGVLHAQSVPVASFTTSFPFYVADQKMPAGSYMVSQISIDDSVLLIRDTHSSHSAFVHYTPTQSTEPVARGEATFHQYRDTDYLSGLTVAGEESGMQLLESAAEKRTAATAHEVAFARSVALQFGVPGY
jgi:hypothetical protein